jgi:serine/threonine protein kinase
VWNWMKSFCFFENIKFISLVWHLFSMADCYTARTLSRYWWYSTCFQTSVSLISLVIKIESIEWRFLFNWLLNNLFVCVFQYRESDSSLKLNVPDQCPKVLKEIIEKCLEKNPHDRPVSSISLCLLFLFRTEQKQQFWLLLFLKTFEEIRLKLKREE